MGHGEDDDLIPAVPPPSLDVHLEGRLGRLKLLEQQLPLGLAGMLRNLDFHLGLLDRQPSLGMLVL